jgi:hypothetical protein
MRKLTAVVALIGAARKGSKGTNSCMRLQENRAAAMLHTKPATRDHGTTNQPVNEGSLHCKLPKLCRKTHALLLIKQYTLLLCSPSVEGRPVFF